jgi:hypothetical protein
MRNTRPVREPVLVTQTASSPTAHDDIRRGRSIVSTTVRPDLLTVAVVLDPLSPELVAVSPFRDRSSDRLSPPHAASTSAAAKTTMTAHGPTSRCPTRS